MIATAAAPAASIAAPEAARAPDDAAPGDDAHDDATHDGRVADTADAAAVADSGAGAPVDFSAVIATTSAPARAIPIPIPIMTQPATPMQIGTHAPQGPGLGGAFAALVLVLGLILGLAWLIKRLPGSGLRQADGLRVVASIALGAKERAAIVQVGEEQLLLGIGAGGVRTLHVLPRPLPEPAPRPALGNLPDFRQLLAQRLRKDT